MAGEKMASRSSPNPTRVRKRVEVDSSPSPPASVDASAGSSLKRARDGSAFTRCEGCSKDVAVALIGFHNCSLDAKIKLNLEAQVVDMPAEAKKKPTTERKKTKSTEQKPKKEKKAKDPNAPKRPPTAFFVFMEEFRKSFMKENPDCKKVSIVAKEGGVKWKSLTEEEKKTYTDKAAELKAEYEKGLEANHAAEAENENEDGENEAPDEEKQENVEDEE